MQKKAEYGMNLSIAPLLYINTSTDFSLKDYYPFGMLMPGRSFSSENYQFGFNGKTKDDEAIGDGNSLDFGARIYDSRLGKWLSIDFEYLKAASSSPYAFGLNNPIYFLDPDGNFVIPENVKETYPNLVPTLGLILAKLQDPANTKILKAMMKWGKFESAEQVYNLFKDGQGPDLSVGNLQNWSKKVTTTGATGPNTIGTSTTKTEYIATPGIDNKGGVADWAETTDQSIVLDMGLLKALEESSEGKASSLGKLARNEAFMLFESTFLHETVHTGKNAWNENYWNEAENPSPADRELKLGYKYGVEEGQEFEKEAYGKLIDAESISLNEYFLKVSPAPKEEKK